MADPVARLQGGIQYFSQYLMLISSFLEGAKVYSENGWGPLPDLTLFDHPRCLLLVFV